MSEQIKDGGPAFPAEGPSPGQFENPGMTLRDYFAAKALAVVYRKPEDASKLSHEHSVRWAAIRAYEMADVMLAAREVEE
jgi:hypothetical protein